MNFDRLNLLSKQIRDKSEDGMIDFPVKSRSIFAISFSGSPTSEKHANQDLIFPLCYILPDINNLTELLKEYPGTTDSKRRKPTSNEAQLLLFGEC